MKSFSTRDSEHNVVCRSVKSYKCPASHNVISQRVSCTAGRSRSRGAGDEHIEAVGTSQRKTLPRSAFTQSGKKRIDEKQKKRVEMIEGLVERPLVRAEAETQGQSCERPIPPLWTDD